MNKQELRRYLRNQYTCKQLRMEESEMLCRHVLESAQYRKAAIIGGYMPMMHEADITPILMDALEKGKSLLLPRCGKATDMTFHHIHSFAELCVGAYGLLEPQSGTALIEISDIDLLLVPLEGIDKLGFRLGKGGGFYDQALPACTGMTLGCALSWQWLEIMQHDPWDIPLHACADKDGIHLFI